MKQLYFIPKGHPRIIYRAVTWSSLQRYGATIAFICLLMGIWWFLHLRPLHQRLILRQQAIHEAKKEQRELVQLQEALKDIESKLEELEQQFASKSPASFVAEWGSCAQKSSLFLISARTYEAPSLSTPVRTPVELQAHLSTEDSQQENIYKKLVFIEFIVQGNFEALQSLMQRLHSLSYGAHLENCILDRYHDDSLSCTFIYKFYL